MEFIIQSRISNEPVKYLIKIVINSKLMIKRLSKIKQSLKSGIKVESDYENGSNDYIELKEKPSQSKEANVYVRYCVLDAFEDVKTVLDLVRDGNSICIIKIKPLKSKDINELKRAISKIKKVCEVMNGDVIGMDEDYLIVSPSFVKVFKGTGNA